MVNVRNPVDVCFALPTDLAVLASLPHPSAVFNQPCLSSNVPEEHSFAHCWSTICDSCKDTTSSTSNTLLALAVIYFKGNNTTMQHSEALV